MENSPFRNLKHKFFWEIKYFCQFSCQLQISFSPADICFCSLSIQFLNASLVKKKKNEFFLHIFKPNFLKYVKLISVQLVTLVINWKNQLHFSGFLGNEHRGKKSPWPVLHIIREDWTYRRRPIGLSSWKKFTSLKTDTNTICGQEAEITVGCEILHCLCWLYCTLRTQHHPQMALASVSGKVNFFHDNGPMGRLLQYIFNLLGYTKYCELGRVVLQLVNDGIHPIKNRRWGWR